MSKKNADREKEEEKDLDEEEEDEDLEEEDEPIVAAPVKKVRALDDNADQHKDHPDDDEDSVEEDPYWWTPHAVMSSLVLIGVLGFFGVFNKILGGIAAHPAGAAHDKAATAATVEAPHDKPAPRAAPPVPPDVAAAPTTATNTPSGLAYRVIKGAEPGPPRRPIRSP